MPVKLKGKKILQKEALDEVCFDLGLTVKPDPQYKDYVIYLDNIYLFRAVLHPEKDYFGVRFASRHFADYTYNREKIVELVDKLIKDKAGRNTTCPKDYSKENHI
jgi:hypothetical protein